MTTRTSTAAPSLVLPPHSANVIVTVEADASRTTAGDVISIAPDLSAGVTDAITVAVVHSTIARTGFRGSVGAGVCVTDACPHVYDNVGIEGLHDLRRGDLQLAALAGVHAWSFAADHYVVKLGGRVRFQQGPFSLVSLPAVTLAVSARDGMPPNRDRLWLPFVVGYPVGGGLSLSIGTGLKTPIDDIGGEYEVPLGLIVQYAYSKELAFGASWVHGKAFAGADVTGSGVDTRGINLWVSAIR